MHSSRMIGTIETRQQHQVPYTELIVILHKSEDLGSLNAKRTARLASVRLIRIESVRFEARALYNLLINETSSGRCTDTGNNDQGGEEGDR